MTATCGCNRNQETTRGHGFGVQERRSEFYVERAYLVPVVEVDGPGVAASGNSLSGGEEAVGDRGERPRAGGAGAEADVLSAGAEVPGGHARVRR